MTEALMPATPGGTVRIILEFLSAALFGVVGAAIVLGTFGIVLVVVAKVVGWFDDWEDGR